MARRVVANKDNTTIVEGKGDQPAIEGRMAQIKAQQEAAQQAMAKSELPAPNPELALAGFDENDRSTWGDPGRNDPCPCGSGKKFKHCHGRLI